MSGIRRRNNESPRQLLLILHGSSLSPKSEPYQWQEPRGYRLPFQLVTSSLTRSFNHTTLRWKILGSTRIKTHWGCTSVFLPLFGVPVSSEIEFVMTTLTPWGRYSSHDTYLQKKWVLTFCGDGHLPLRDTGKEWDPVLVMWSCPISQ